jgi:hypothetical protein
MKNNAEDHLLIMSLPGDDGLAQELAGAVATTPDLDDHVVLVVELTGPDRIALGKAISSRQAVDAALTSASITKGTPRTMQLVERPEVEGLLARHGFALPRPLGPLPRDQVRIVRVGVQGEAVEVVRPVPGLPPTRRRRPR